MDRGFNVHLAVDLFWAGKITIKIVEGQARSDKAQEEHRMRLGYMGHLTLIAEEVVKFTERHPPELLSDTVLEYVMAPEWVNYVEVTLCETRERDNAILGGVKPESQRQAQLNSVASLGGGSSALADAGLNGGGSNLEGMDLNGSSTSNSFTLSGNSLLSGFGSSSDEEDEELDEDMNDDDRGGSGAEVGRPFSLDSLEEDLENYDDNDFDMMDHMGSPEPDNRPRGESPSAENTRQSQF
jgi:SIT4-associating protein SAP185/190